MRHFVEECYRAAADFPDVTVNEVILDAMAMRLVRDPQNFDVVVTTNMFGGILSDEAAGLVGGLGMAPRLYIGDGDFAMAQATHGSAPDIAGSGRANPCAMTIRPACFSTGSADGASSPKPSPPRSRWNAP